MPERTSSTKGAQMYRLRSSLGLPAVVLYLGVGPNLSAGTAAQAYPVKPIRLIVGQQAGSALDNSAQVRLTWPPQARHRQVIWPEHCSTPWAALRLCTYPTKAGPRQSPLCSATKRNTC